MEPTQTEPQTTGNPLQLKPLHLKPPDMTSFPSQVYHENALFTWLIRRDKQ